MWIELHDSARDHPKILKLARRLAISNAHALGLMTSLWTWTLRMAADGDLSSFDVEDIETGAGWVPLDGRLVSAMVELRLVDVIDGCHMLHDWDVYSGSLKAAARARQYRRRKTYTNTAPSRDSHVTVTSPSRDGHVIVHTHEHRLSRVTQTDRPTDRQTDREDRPTRAREATDVPKSILTALSPDGTNPPNPPPQDNSRPDQTRPKRENQATTPSHSRPSVGGKTKKPQEPPGRVRESKVMPGQPPTQEKASNRKDLAQRGKRKPAANATPQVTVVSSAGTALGGIVPTGPPGLAMVQDRRPGELYPELAQVCQWYAQAWGADPELVPIPDLDHLLRWKEALTDTACGATQADRIKTAHSAIRGHHKQASKDGSQIGRDLRHVVPEARLNGRRQSNRLDLDRYLEYVRYGRGKRKHKPPPVIQPHIEAAIQAETKEAEAAVVRTDDGKIDFRATVEASLEGEKDGQ